MYEEAQAFVPDGYQCCVDAVGVRARLTLQKAVQVLAAGFQKDIGQRKTTLSKVRAELEEEAVGRGTDRVEEIPGCMLLASFSAHGEGDPGDPLTRALSRCGCSTSTGLSSSMRCVRS
jgi:hypothetical protein